MPGIGAVLGAALKGLGTTSRGVGRGATAVATAFGTGARPSTTVGNYFSKGNLGFAIPGMYFGGKYAIPMMGEIGKSGVQSVGDQIGIGPESFNLRNAKRAYADTRRMLEEKRREAIKQQQLREDVAINASTLAATAPHLYNQLLAGRRLPKGATVLGGAPQTNLLEELAYRMAQGQFAAGPSSTLSPEYLDLNDFL